MRSFNGIQYVPLTRVCDVYKLDWSWDNYSKVAVLKGRDSRILLQEGNRTVIVNGSASDLRNPPFLNEGAVYVPISFVTDFLGEVKAVPEAEKFLPSAPGMIRTVVIDAGHGGYNIGAHSRGSELKEKELTLSIAKRLKGILEERGMRVVLTRDSDIFLPLSTRAGTANGVSADLFVSVHANASRAKGASGFECYYFNDTSPEASLMEKSARSHELASYICSSAEKNLAINDRGVKSAGFQVLKETRMPGVLVEVGFVTNRFEALRLKNPVYLDKVSNTLAEGIMAYKNKFESKKSNLAASSHSETAL